MFLVLPSGDLVWIINPRVVQQVSDVVYIIRRPHGKTEVAIHRDRMKPYTQRHSRFDVPSTQNQKEQLREEILKQNIN